MKNKKPISAIDKLILSMGITAGFFGIGQMVLKKLKEMMKMEGVSIKEVIAGMVSAYNDILAEKDEEIKEIKEDLATKEKELVSLKQDAEDDAIIITDLNERIKEIKSEKKKTKKVKKNAELQTVTDRPEPAY